ncbi:MAG TPA: tetratricopeptide repeat protein, partial [Thermohalobaculum sp.]|nr:tetratricopeptide repeat protein [Thermohalobaculum sp.]
MTQKPADLEQRLKALLQRAVTLHREQKYDEAAPLYRSYLALRPGNAGAWTNLGALLRRQGLHAPSIAVHRRALQIDPGLTSAWNNLANALADHGDFAESATIRQRLLDAQPDNPVRIRDVCAAWRGLGRHDEVIALVDAAEARLGDIPGMGECRLQRALSHLTLGNYGPGFADFEFRYEGDEVSLPENAPWTRWQGQDLRGKRIVVIPEQGFGDAILMARFLPGLKAAGAHVTLVAKPPLSRLFEHLEGVDEITGAARAGDAYGFWTPNMSLPALIGLPGGRPPPPPRLHIPQDSRNRARALTAPHAGRFKIGIVWTGSTTYRANNRRSTGPESFLALATLPGVQLFSLYKGAAHDAFLRSGMAGLILDACGPDRDFADTAAIIEQMDLLITT